MMIYFLSAIIFVSINVNDAFLNKTVDNLIPAEDHRNSSLLRATRNNCTPAAIYEFPSDGLTRGQRREGWITIHVLLTCYCFIVLSIVCDNYFVPAIQSLVKRLNISEDVAGASFMAITSASPELFINCVGTFVTEGDLGVGTVVGSNVFNILAAPALCGLFARTAFRFEWWTIIRDGLTYAVSVILLIVTLYDDKVYWYEALVFVFSYAVYIATMYYDKFIRKKLKMLCGQSNDDELNNLNETEQNHHLNHELENSNGKVLNAENNKEEILMVKGNLDEDEEDDQSLNLWIYPKDDPWYRQAWWILIWPTVLGTTHTIPNCRKHPRMYLLALLMCMVWIGTICYLLAWLITAIGDTIGIPDSVMGLSFLAVGSSMPEIVTCFIVSKQGQGVMGMSSALGANTFEVLLCLGLPWLIKTCFYPKVAGNHWININSSGLAYNATCLLSTLIFLYICLICNRFKLDGKVGVICLLMYGVFLIVGTLIELNVFFEVNLPTCE